MMYLAYLSVSIVYKFDFYVKNKKTRNVQELIYLLCS